MTEYVSPIHILKFGGAAMGSCKTLRNSVAIIDDACRTSYPVVVVSAATGVTDILVEASNSAPHSQVSCAKWIKRVRKRYLTLAVDVISDEAVRSRYGRLLNVWLTRLRSLLAKRPIPEDSAIRDAVMATGERLMSPLLVAALIDAGCAAQAIDAASLVKTDASYGRAEVDWPETKRRIREWHSRVAMDKTPVVTGFIGSAADGNTTTLGRGGSDYSAALFARAITADRLERWTDVDGLYTDDPAKNDDATRLPHIPMEKARKWTRRGRLGLHPRTLEPLSAADIPVHVRCIHQPCEQGTRIFPSSSVTDR